MLRTAEVTQCFLVEINTFGKFLLDWFYGNCDVEPETSDALLFVARVATAFIPGSSSLGK